MPQATPSRQQQLPLDPETFSTRRVAKAKPPSLAEQNAEAAEIILGDPSKYEGLMAEWARLVREKAAR